MGMIPRPIMMVMVLAGCTSSPPPERVSKARWMECWTLCGKKDNLSAVSNAHCICKGGVKIERDENEDATGEQKTETVPVEIFDWLMK